jgi:hypothetical protein
MKMFSFILFSLWTSGLLAGLEKLELSEGTFSYYSSQNLSTPAPKVKEAVVVVHGSERNADRYFSSMQGIAKSLRGEEALVVAPHFKEIQDPRDSQEFYFHPEGWLSGEGALNHMEVSSFRIMDEIVKRLMNKDLFPHLKRLIITGHSAGGQLTQRYALGTQVTELYPSVQFQFVVVNPGSYVYLSSQRPVAPEENCDFDRYKYGLEKLPFYFESVPKEKLVEQYLKKDITYLVGVLDNVEEGIDQSCPARSQGQNRLERARNFKAQLDLQFSHAHRILEVPGVGHTQHGMYNSSEGRSLLFPLYQANFLFSISH